MKLLTLILLTLSLNSLAAQIKVMSFNTMCDLCKGSDFFKYDQRVSEIQSTISKLDPDLISLQEVRTISQLKNIFKIYKNYEIIASDYVITSYADPAIIYNKKKFSLIQKGQFWLGPNEGKFSLGWKFALPRQVHWVKLKTKESSKEFYFVSSHFDNRLENLAGSVDMMRHFLADKSLPVIFAADTNMTIDMPEYKKLTKNLLLNAFDIKAQFTAVGNYKSEKELCYLRKGKKFPECRVDHILLSKNTPWKVFNFIIDASRKSKDHSFSSDHRAVMAVIGL